MDAIEAMETCRAMRYLKPHPVEESLIRRVLKAAASASSPGNSQGWDFVVVRDGATRAKIAAAIRGALKPVMPEPSGAEDPVRRRMLRGVHHLLDRLEDVPVWIFLCGAPVYPPNAPDEEWISAALYPAAQNLIVAARSLGLGSVLTTFHRLPEKELRAILGLPEEIRIGVTLPLGWPERSFGPVARRPLDESLHWERW